MSQRVRALNTLAYGGVNALTPPNFENHPNPPTANDWQGYIIGDLWFIYNTALTDPIQLWMLASLSQTQAQGRALWIRLYPFGNAFGAVLQMPTDMGIGFPDVNGNLNFPGSTNIQTAGGANYVQAILKDDVVIANSLAVTALGVNPGLAIVNNVGLFGTTSGTLNGQVFVWNGAGSGAWNRITSTGGTVTISFPGPSMINLEAAGVGSGALTFHNDNAVDALVIGAAITMAGGLNILTAGSNPGPTGVVTINLDTSIYLPVTNGTFGTKSGSTGMYALGANSFMHGFGVHNTFLGQSAGNILGTLTGTENTGVGNNALTDLEAGTLNTAIGNDNQASNISGSRNTSVGYSGLTLLTTGNNNTSLSNGLSQLLTGSNNIGIGVNAGINLVAAESDNLYIANDGVLGESGNIRIGRNGTQTNAYMTGIYQAALAGTKQVCLIDSNDKLGSGTPPTDGQVLIGATGASVQWAGITPGAGITVVHGPNSITINAVGGAAGGINTVHTNAGDASEDPADTSITVVGANVITTSGAVHTVTVKVINSGAPGANQAPIMLGTQTTLVPAWGLLTSSGGTVTISRPSATVINLEAGGATASSFVTDDGNTENPLAGVLNVLGGASSGFTNIHTFGINASNTTRIALNDAIIWPATNVTGGTPQGVIFIGANAEANRFMHAYGTNNTFLGISAGRRVVGLTSARSTGIGHNALNSLSTGNDATAVGNGVLTALTTGISNTAIGSGSSSSITTGFSNTACGYGTLNSVVSGFGNIAIGTINSEIGIGGIQVQGVGSGSSLTGADSYNIIIGNTGVLGDTNTIRIGTNGPSGGLAQHNKCYVGGIYQPNINIGDSLVWIHPTSQLFINGGTAGGGSQSTNGNILIGGAGGPQWKTITSNDLSITIVNGPQAIDLSVTPTVAFIAHSIGTYPAYVTGNGQVWYMESSATRFVTDYTTIIGGVGVFTPGPGGSLANGGYFTAPYNGIYSFTCQFRIGWAVYVPPPPPPPPPTPPTCPVFIETYRGGVLNQSFLREDIIGIDLEVAGRVSYPYTVNVLLNAADVVKFSISILTPTEPPPYPSPNVYVLGAGLTTGPGTGHSVGTYCSGYLVKRI